MPLVPPLPPGSVRDTEARRPGGDVAANVDARNAEGVGEFRALVMLGVDDVVAVVAETEVGQQLGADGDIHARGQAVVGAVGVAAVVADAESGSAGRAEHDRAGERVPEPREALERVHLLVEGVVAALRPLVAVEEAGAGLVEVGVQSVACPRRYQAMPLV